MRHGEQIILFFMALILAPFIFLLFFPLMFYVRLAPPQSGVTIGLVVSNRWSDLLQYMRLPFDLALFRAGARVRTITPRHHDKIEAILKEIDGLILTGGEDINPTLHDGDDSLLVDVNEERDNLEMDILDIADKQSIPYLCVCRGSQLMAIRSGGTITSHHYNDKKIGNHISSLTNVAKHAVNLVNPSRIASIFGKTTIEVNSFHHLLITSSGESAATGHAANDVVEVVEKPGANFALGVQWHPEFMAPFDQSQQRLFDSLVKFCAKKKASATEVTRQQHSEASGNNRILNFIYNFFFFEQKPNLLEKIFCYIVITEALFTFWPILLSKHSFNFMPIFNLMFSILFLQGYAIGRYIALINLLVLDFLFIGYLPTFIESFRPDSGIDRNNPVIYLVFLTAAIFFTLLISVATFRQLRRLFTLNNQHN